MTHLGYLIAGWGISLGAIGLYSWSIISRGKALGRRVTPGQRRWITSDE